MFFLDFLRETFCRAYFNMFEEYLKIPQEDWSLIIAQVPNINTIFLGN